LIFGQKFLVNFKDRPVTIHAKQHIASCESYYEQYIPTTQRCNNITVKPELEPGMVPTHVKDLFDKSSEHLQDREKQQFAELLTKYQDVFSKSADDLGRTDSLHLNRDRIIYIYEDDKPTSKPRQDYI
jgi:hypothetical protein